MILGSKEISILLIDYSQISTLSDTGLAGVLVISPLVSGSLEFGNTFLSAGSSHMGNSLKCNS